jgi:hypothetical protein
MDSDTLRLRERSSDWRRKPFTSASAGHILVYSRGWTALAGTELEFVVCADSYERS